MTELPVPAGVSVRRDVVHTKVPGFRPLSLDLYLADVGVRAICVYIHGGGWRTGSRREGPGPLSPRSSSFFGRMAAQGLAVASVDYRLSGEALFPAQVDDVRAACRWLTRDDASPVQDLPLVLFGVSSGGHLAALCGLDAGIGARAVALWYPVTDLLAMPTDIESAGGSPDRGPGSREALLLGTPPEDAPDLARAASPACQVQADPPPFLLIHGAADTLVPPQQSERLAAALREQGGQPTVMLVSEQTHMFATIAEEDLESFVDRTTDFLLTHVGSVEADLRHLGSESSARAATSASRLPPSRTYG